MPEPEKNLQANLEDAESKLYRLGDLGIFLLSPSSIHFLKTEGLILVGLDIYQKILLA